MINRIRAFALLCVAAMGLTACDDLLTEVPFAFIAPENLYTTETGANAALSGAYAAFQASVGDLGISNNDYYGRHFWMLVDYPDETMSLRLGATNERTQPDIFRVDPSHNYIMGVWRAAFHAVNRANSVITNLEGSSAFNAQARDRIIGQARFLRAYHYFNLVRLFGGVPLFLEETRSLDDIRKPRASQAEVYQAIIADLEAAVTVLPESWPANQRGRATKGAAQALLAKVYLQYGAVAGGGSAAFQQAERWARDALTAGSLLPDYARIFIQTNEGNAEVIFAIQNAAAPGAGGRMCNQFAPRPLPSQVAFPYCDGQNPSFNAEWPFFYSYHPDDTRKAATWLLSYTKKTGELTVWDSTHVAASLYGAPGPVPHKYMDKNPNSQAGAEEPDFILIRYADVLLSLAEAINENSGPTAEAYDLVDQVRTRAGIPPLARGLSKDQFKDALFLERRYEFAGEAHGHFDSQRHWEWAKRRIEEHTTPEARAFWIRPRPSTCRAAGSTCLNMDSSIPKVQLSLGDHHKFYPIPQPARDANPLLDQNPGY
jgi:starch-binding outer membrane protein, SusD/RagB family